MEAFVMNIGILILILLFMAATYFFSHNFGLGGGEGIFGKGGVCGFLCGIGGNGGAPGYFSWGSEGNTLEFRQHCISRYASFACKKKIQNISLH